MSEELETRIKDGFWEGFNYSFGEIPSPKNIVQVIRQLPKAFREIRNNEYERRAIIGSLTGVVLDIAVVYLAPPFVIGTIIYDIVK